MVLHIVGQLANDHLTHLFLRPPAQQQCVLQAENPKQQYLLLRALNEVITSLTADTSLPERQQDEVSSTYLSLSWLHSDSHLDMDLCYGSSVESVGRI